MSLAIIHVLDISIWFSFLRKSIKFKKWSEKILIYLKWNSIFPRGKKRSVACEMDFLILKFSHEKNFHFLSRTRWFSFSLSFRRREKVPEVLNMEISFAFLSAYTSTGSRSRGIFSTSDFPTDKFSMWKSYLGSF